MFFLRLFSMMDDLIYHRKHSEGDYIQTRRITSAATLVILADCSNLFNAAVELSYIQLFDIYWLFFCFFAEFFLISDKQTPLKKSRFDFLVQIIEKCPETNETRKKKYPIFFRVIVKIHGKLTSYFEYKNDHNSKNKNRKNVKIDFSFVSEHSCKFKHFWKKNFLVLCRNGTA